MQIQSWQLRAGSLKNMQIRSAELPPPAAHEVQVAVKSIGLNFADIFAIWGLYGATPQGEFVPGLEYAGIMTAVGQDVKNVKPGDRVMGLTRFGAYTTGLNIDARYVAPLPADWSFETGAAYLVQTLTAYYGLINLGELQAGHTVLIHSAAGGVGLQALRICQAYGAFTIGTVGSAAKVDFAKKEGFDEVIVRSKNFKNDLKKALGGRGLNLVMDSVGGDYFFTPFKMLAPTGRIVVFGSARYASVGNRPNFLRMLYYWYTRPKIDPQKLIEKNRGVLGFNLIWLYENVDLMYPILLKLQDMQLKPPHVGHVFSFEKMHDAILLFQTGKTVGKVVVNVG
ncbi:MAG TPA: zinc-binding dehydrogenase [Saprospiraceae bacterium]|nr:zinc-binding dehydrogenase [Saprospiraceae bacterium]